MINTAYPSTQKSIGVVGIIFASMIAFSPVNYFLNEVIGKGPSFLIYYILSMGVPFAIIHSFKKKSEGSVQYQFIPKDILVVLLVILATLALQWGVSSPIANSIPMSESIKELFQEIALSMNNWYGLISVAIAAPLLEELIFRGVLLDGLLKRRSAWSAIIISSILFGIVHLNPWQFVSAMIIGVFAGWVYYRTRSLIYSIFVHFANNFTAGIFMAMDEDNSMMDAELPELYGGTENMYLIIGLCLVIASLCIYSLNKRMKDERLPDERDISLKIVN